MEFSPEQLTAIEAASRAALSGLASLPRGFHRLPPVEKHAASISILAHVNTLASQGDANAVTFISSLSPRQGTTPAAIAADKRKASGAQLIRDYLDSAPPYPVEQFHGRGIVTCAGGSVYQLQAWVLFSLLRRLGCKLPIECWYAGAAERDPAWIARVGEKFNVKCIDAVSRGFNGHWFAPLTKFDATAYTTTMLTGYSLKSFAMKHSAFREVLFLDADNCPTRDVTELFGWPEFRQAGAVFWADCRDAVYPKWEAFGIAQTRPLVRWEVGQMLLDKSRPDQWRALCLADWFHAHATHFFQHSWGDTGTMQAAWRIVGAGFEIPAGHGERIGDVAIRQNDFAGEAIFYHRAGPAGKWRKEGAGANAPTIGYSLNEWCAEAVREYGA